MGRTAARAAALLGALAAVGVGCKSGAKGEKLRRSSDAAAAVEVVSRAPAEGKPRTEVTEQEPNDGAAQATPLSFDAVARGRLETPADVDRYLLTVTTPGTLTATVGPVEGLDLIVELRDRADAVLAKSDRGGAKVLEGIGGYPVSAGTYQLVLRAYVKPSKAARKAKPAPAEPAPPSEAYEVTAQITEPGGAGQELEPNEDAGTANDLAIGETVSGRLGWNGDVDVWKVSTEVLASGDALDLELSAIDGVTFSVDVQDGMSRSQTVRKGERGQALQVHGWRPDPAASPRYLYLVVRGERSHPQQAYQLALTGRLLKATDELEPNDEPERAQPLAAEGVQDAYWDLGDVDCFAVPSAPGARWIEVTIDVAAGANLAAELLVAGRAVATSDGGKGVSEHLLAEVPAGVAAVVRVRGASKAVPGPYQVRWTEGDAMPPEEGAVTTP